MANPIYVADLETTTDPDDCRVWGWGFCEVGHTDCMIGTSMDRLMELILAENSTTYFHNLKFDGDFVLVWLYEHGYSLTKSNKNMNDFEFTTLISDKGVFYSITIKTPHSKVQIKDSYKILPFKVAQIAKGFKLPSLKGEIDYDKPRHPGYQPDETERRYIENDVIIVCQALAMVRAEGLTSSTQASNAMQDYKKIVTPKVFKRWYPIQPIWKHDELAQSYKGGFTYANPRFQNQIVGPGIVLDKNSMYPWVMATKPLPVREPEYFDGQYEYDSLFPLYVQMIKCQFELKKDRLPTIQLKMAGPWNQTEYLTSSTIRKFDKKGNEIVNETEPVLCLTNVDLKLFLENYDVYNLEYIGGYKFRQSLGLFTDYINKWYKRKEQATIEGNAPQRQISKLMLNALYGKFGTSPHAIEKYPLYDNGKIRYVIDKQGEREKDSIYVPMASFITSYAREECIRSAQSVYDRFLYADTDSLHLVGLEKPSLDIDPVRLGAWKCEGVFRRGKYIRSKTYVEELYGNKIEGKVRDLSQSQIEEILSDLKIPDTLDYALKVTCAGLPADCHSQVTFDNFQAGASYFGKLTPKHVKGGTVLIPSEFTIKP